MDFFFLGLEESLGSDNKFVKLNRLVDFEKFRKTLKGIYTQDMTRQGRPAFDFIMMFKLLLLGQWYSLSDRELASSLRLRIDFMYFTGFTPTSNLPDYSTINKFRNLLIEKRKYKKLFKELNKQLEALGLSINNAKGAIIDATLVESAGRPDKYMDIPVEDIKEDEGSNSNLSYGKDADARWIKKGKKSHYGYKVFASVDDEHGFIQTIHTESAEVYEAHRLEIMLDDVNCKHLLADKAYDTAANRELLKAKKINNRILQKSVRNKPLTKRQKRRNILISKIRCKVERCFGTMKRKFSFSRASYFSTVKVNAQALLKAMCFNALKAVNMMA
ncbi:IS5 family transposase [Francisella hispaniensis]|uniref:IS5 family transposase n=1 Tax=Francisella hispaniensis TaxID=622488 RepID=UPI0019081254|nr:IS5 family transposase [Francisella hispaniensis]MBK2356803.1 IS5 family transposase [Francisella hispaniensis]